MPPSLVALAGPLKGETIPLSADPVTIGRETSNRVQPHDLSLSRRHCVAAVDAERVRLTDLDSLNGTFVNGIPIKERVLEHGDRVQIGESVFLFVEHEAARPEDDLAELTDDPVGRSTVRLARQDVATLQFDRAADVGPSPPRSAHHLEVLLRIGAALGSIRSLDVLQRTIVDLLLDAVPADRAALLLSENAGTDFVSVYARGRHPGMPVQISRTVVRQVMGEGIAVFSNDASRGDTFPASETLIRAATPLVLCAPMTLSDTLQGAVYLANSDVSVRFDADHVRLVVGIAGVAGLALQNVRHIERLQHEASELRADLTLQHNLVGESAPMRHVYDRVAKAAPTDATILILGESGTGKELIARAIHQNSPRTRRPFIAINAAAMAETLLESELFGHERGAFTGAIAQKQGQLERADGGTVFLDEIGELSPALQVKLLRVLQEREFMRVGGIRPIKLDVRFVAATHKDLAAAVKDGGFRQDLYYRLNVVAVHVPPLRDRRADIPLLAGYFLSRFSARCKRRVVGLSEDARAALIHYDWPGNVRELENAIERAVVLGSTERLQLEDLPETVLEQRPAATGDATDYHHAVQDAKRQIVRLALAQASGNRSEAARQLGVHPNNLHRLIRNLNVVDGAGS